MNDLNKTVYQSQTAVETYSRLNELQIPEQVILNLLKHQMGDMSMLDIGVGAGRTTLYFAPLVKNYTAIDYSFSMIKSCQKKYEKQFSHVRFEVCDARDLSRFKENSFDFILFSYNGIDYMNQEDRQRSLSQIHRLGKPGGYFCFSTHNTLYLSKFLNIKWTKNPIRLYRFWQRSCQVKILMKTYNGIEQIPQTILRDGGEEFKVKTYYVNPLRQAEELKGMDYKNIRMFLETDGSDFDPEKSASALSDERWIYFLCQK